MTYYIFFDHNFTVFVCSLTEDKFFEEILSCIHPLAIHPITHVDGVIMAFSGSVLDRAYVYICKKTAQFITRKPS